MAGKGINPKEVEAKCSYYENTHKSLSRTMNFVPPTLKALGGWSVTSRSVGDPRFPWTYHQYYDGKPLSRPLSGAEAPYKEPPRVSLEELRHWMDRNQASLMLIGTREPGGRRKKQILYQPGKERPPKLKPAHASIAVGTTPRPRTSSGSATAAIQSTTAAAAAAINFLNKDNERGLADERLSISRSSSRPKTVPAPAPAPAPAPGGKHAPLKGVPGSSLLVPSMIELRHMSVEDLVQSLRDRPDWLPQSNDDDDALDMDTSGPQQPPLPPCAPPPVLHEEVVSNRLVTPAAQAPPPPRVRMQKDAWGLQTDQDRTANDTKTKRLVVTKAKDEGAQARTIAHKYGLTQEEVINMWGRFNAIDVNMDRVISWIEFMQVRDGIPFQPRRALEKAFGKCTAANRALTFEQFLGALAPLQRANNANVPPAPHRTWK